LCPLFPRAMPCNVMREREIEGGSPHYRLDPRSGARGPSPPTRCPHPFSRHSPRPSLANDSTTLIRGRRQSPSARLCAVVLPAHGTRAHFAGPLSLSLFFVLVLPLPLLAFFLSLCLISFSLSWSLLSFARLSPSLLPRRSLYPFPFPLFSLFLSLSLALSSDTRAIRPTRAPHTITRASPARATTHMAGRPLLLAECAVLPPLQGTVSRGPQAATARSAQHGLCSFVSRAHDTSQRRTERPDRQIALSLPGSACGAFSLPLFLSPILFLSPFSPFFVLSPCATVFSLSSSLLSPCCPDWRARARYITPLGPVRQPRDVSSIRSSRGPRAAPSVVLFTRRRVPDSRLANSSVGGILSVC